jgi:hypothetical protein
MARTMGLFETYESQLQSLKDIEYISCKCHDSEIAYLLYTLISDFPSLIHYLQGNLVFLGSDLSRDV